jgi:hypothetical protein
MTGEGRSFRMVSVKSFGRAGQRSLAANFREAGRGVEVATKWKWSLTAVVVGVVVVVGNCF